MRDDSNEFSCYLLYKLLLYEKRHCVIDGEMRFILRNMPGVKSLLLNTKKVPCLLMFMIYLFKVARNFFR